MNTTPNGWRSRTALLLSAFLFLFMVSCSQDESLTQETTGLQFVVGGFPAYGESGETRAIGTEDPGKTAWEEGDQLLLSVTFDNDTRQSISIAYINGEWTPQGNIIPRSAIGQILAVYAPHCAIRQDGNIGLVDGKTYGLAEYIPAEASLHDNTVSITFTEACRTYSRLRIAGSIGDTYTVSTQSFTPAGSTSVATEPYTLTTDGKGNAYLYGTFPAGATVCVKRGDVTLKDYIFTSDHYPGGTDPGKSYALDARPKTGKSVVFVEGVTTTSGWYDVNKVGKGENGDINMCWAASASNIIQWWQDRYVDAGNTLPAQAVTGVGETYELALMEVFHSQWNNNKGGQVAEAVPWYFEGVNYGLTASPGSQAYPLSDTSGGYFKDVWSGIYPHLYHEYTYMLGMYNNLYVGEFNNYALWGGGSNLLGEERLRYFTQLLVDFVDRGIASLTVSLSSNLQTLHHATTVWG